MTQLIIDRATLEQLVGALEAVLDDHEDLASCEARHELRTALTQQELLQKERPDFMAGYDAGMADAKRMAQQGEPPTHERVYETIIQWDEGGGKRSRRELTRRIEALYTAAPAPQPAQGEPTGCACRWDADDNRVATCARHQGWLDVVHEWAERAKAAEDDCHLQPAQSEDGCAPNHMCNGHRVHIPTGECCNKCGATSW